MFTHVKERGVDRYDDGCSPARTSSSPGPITSASKHRSHHLVASVIDTVVNLAKRRGLVYPAGEIYGGTKPAVECGALGVGPQEQLKRHGWGPVGPGRAQPVRLHAAPPRPRAAV